MWKLILYFDPVAWKQEMESDNDPNPILTKDEMEAIGNQVNNEMSHFYGYSGWKVERDAS